MADCGAFIGTIQRLRRVVKRLPGAELRLARRAFEATVRQHEDARHNLEHPDTAIPEIAPTGQGALGALAWLYLDGSGLRIMSLFPGHVAAGAQSQIRMQQSIRPPVDHIWITIGDAHYYLTSAADAVDQLSERLQIWSASYARE